MRPLSHSARTLLERLYHPWGQPPKVSAEEETRLLGQIGQLREPAGVPLLVSLLYGRSDRASGVAAGTIQEIVDRCGPLELAQLDWTVRRVSEWRGPAVPAINLVAVARGLTGVLGVMSFHASGHVREAAVRILGTSLDPQALPFLLIRLNDWVSPVRAAATEVVRDRLVPSHVATLVWCLPLIYRLREQSRGDHEQVVQAMLDLLRRPECRSELQAGLRARDRQTRHLSFKLLAEGGGSDLVGVMEAASHAEDTTLRLRAAQWLREHLVAESLQAALDRLLEDRFMPVRREALYGFVERLPGWAKGRLRAGLLDPHVSIRELARFHLRGPGETDHAELYRRLLNAPDGTLAVAIAGLGETGVAADAPAVSKYLADADPRVRRAAVRSLSRLDPDGHNGELLAAVADESPLVDGRPSSVG